jgi:hypothetical protein
MTPTRCRWSWSGASLQITRSVAVGLACWRRVPCVASESPATPSRSLTNDFSRTTLSALRRLLSSARHSAPPAAGHRPGRRCLACRDDGHGDRPGPVVRRRETDCWWRWLFTHSLKRSATCSVIAVPARGGARVPAVSTVARRRNATAWWRGRHLLVVASAPDPGDGPTAGSSATTHPTVSPSAAPVCFVTPSAVSPASARPAGPPG